MIAHKNSLNKLSGIVYLYDDMYHKEVDSSFEAILSNEINLVDNLSQEEKLKICQEVFGNI
jgi:hypothetical protein